jgi:hypothetical protein
MDNTLNIKACVLVLSTAFVKEIFRSDKYRYCPGSIPGQSMWDLWWIK